MARDIKTLHTKLLLGKLSRTRRDAYDKEYYPNYFKPPEFSYEELKAELATREHIPNKAERKKMRQEAAKKGNRKTHKKNSK